MPTRNWTIHRAKRGLMVCAAGLAALGLGAGCSDQDEAADEDGLQLSACDPNIDGGVGSIDGGVVTDGGADADADAAPEEDPLNGARLVEVTANGTGCPAGTWEAQLSEDRTRFTVALSAFRAEIDEETSVDIKNCQLGIKLSVPEGQSFAVRNFSFYGYAYLQEGASARQSVNYYFQGNPTEPEVTSTELRGPYDDEYVFTDSVPEADRVWSPCGVERSLQVNTTIRLRNGEPASEGMFEISSIPAPGLGAASFELAWRTCD